MIARFILAVIVVAALFGGWFYIMDWTAKFHTKSILKKVFVSLLFAIPVVLTLIFISSHISGI